MDKISVIVLSCSKYSDMWDNNIFLFEKYWPNHPSIALVSDKEGRCDVKTKQYLKIYNEDMSDRLIHALKDTESDYILLTFDDYYIRSFIHDSDIDDLLEVMGSCGADYCRIFRRPFVPRCKRVNKTSYYFLPLNSVYQVNFYPCIWKKTSLLKVLKSGEDIWKTEVRLTRRSRENNLTCLYLPWKKIFPFKDIIRKGKYLISAKRFIKKNNLFLSERETRTIKETTNLFFRTLATKTLPRFLKEPLKKAMRKRGRIIYSDFENNDD